LRIAWPWKGQRLSAERRKALFGLSAQPLWENTVQTIIDLLIPPTIPTFSFLAFTYSPLDRVLSRHSQTFFFALLKLLGINLIATRHTVHPGIFFASDRSRSNCRLMERSRRSPLSCFMRCHCQEREYSMNSTWRINLTIQLQPLKLAIPSI